MAEGKIRIVVVEDSDEVRELLTLVLEQDGYAVTACAAADEAFDAVMRERPSLVLTDLMLGASSGLDLITRLRSDLTSPPSIIACSGFSSFEDESLQRGAEVFVPKPFEVPTIRQTVQTVLARKSISERDRDEAVAQSHALRERAVAAARDMLNRLAPRRQELRERASWTSRFLPSYFGFGDAFHAILQGDDLEVMASSNVRIWELGSRIDSSLCRDILETNSALLVPDLEVLGATVSRMHERPVRFFAGLPVASGQIAVGALCFVAEQPHRMNASEFSILEAYARNASAWATHPGSDPTPIWDASGLLSREGLGVIISAELTHPEQVGRSMTLFTFVGQRPSFASRKRIAVAALGNGRHAVLFAQPDDAREPLALIREIVATGEFEGGSLVDLQRGASHLDAGDVLRTAEGALDAALRSAPGTIKQVVIRVEPFVSDFKLHSVVED